MVRDKNQVKNSENMLMYSMQHNQTVKDLVKQSVHHNYENQMDNWLCSLPGVLIEVTNWKQVINFVT